MYSVSMRMVMFITILTNLLNCFFIPKLVFCYNTYDDYTVSINVMLSIIIINVPAYLYYGPISVNTFSTATKRKHRCNYHYKYHHVLYL